MIFTILCIKEFVKSFPFENNVDIENKKEDSEKKDSESEIKKQNTKFIFMSATLDIPIFLKYFN